MTDDETPKLYQHCVIVYDVMVKHADDTSDGKMYVGSISKLLPDIGVTQSYQSRITARLRNMGCITMYKRGGGIASSVWLLHEPPTYELFKKSDETGDIRYQKNKEKTDELTQRYNDLARRLSVLEAWALDQGAPL